MKLLITGGAGFIGSAVIRYVIQNTKNSKYSISGPYGFYKDPNNQLVMFLDFRLWKVCSQKLEELPDDPYFQPRKRNQVNLRLWKGCFQTVSGIVG
jgi:hypothetical protein